MIVTETDPQLGGFLKQLKKLHKSVKKTVKGTVARAIGAGGGGGGGGGSSPSAPAVAPAPAGVVSVPMLRPGGGLPRPIAFGPGGLKKAARKAAAIVAAPPGSLPPAAYVSTPTTPQPALIPIVSTPTPLAPAGVARGAAAAPVAAPSSVVSVPGGPSLLPSAPGVPMAIGPAGGAALPDLPEDVYTWFYPAGYVYTPGATGTVPSWYQDLMSSRDDELSAGLFESDYWREKWDAAVAWFKEQVAKFRAMRPALAASVKKLDAALASARRMGRNTAELDALKTRANAALSKQATLETSVNAKLAEIGVSDGGVSGLGVLPLIPIVIGAAAVAAIMYLAGQVITHLTNSADLNRQIDLVVSKQLTIEDMERLKAGGATGTGSGGGPLDAMTDAISSLGYVALGIGALVVASQVLPRLLPQNKAA